MSRNHGRIRSANPKGVPELSWGNPLTLTLAAGTSFDAIGRITLVRLGSVTHQNDMGQRFLDLGCFWESGSDPAGQVVLSVNGPEDANIAPPGYYMLFALSESGTPSEGHYVKVGG